jgi:predicted DNA-binding transcriptional regulator YafY
MFAAAAGSPVEDDLHSALEKLTKALSPKMRAYLDRLTTVLTWKAEPGRRGGTRAEARYREDIVRATLEHRTIEMTYHSLSSRRVKNYRVEPYRLTFGNGGLYLFAFVPIYGQMRSFAVHRVQALRVLEESFSAVQELSGEPYRHSFGVFTGKPEPVRILFTPSVAPYVEEGQWHESQALEKQPDGSVVLAMNVCVDLALRSWILGFGHQARVLKPSSLAETILEELEEAREQYAPRMSFELPPAIYDEKQLPLSFTGSRGPARRPRPTSSNGRRQVPPPPPAPAHRRKAAGE